VNEPPPGTDEPGFDGPGLDGPDLDGPDLADVDIEVVAVTMTRALRARGVRAPLDAAVAYAAALHEVARSDEPGPGRRGPRYWAGRATLVHRPEDIAPYDEVFDSVFGGARLALAAAPGRPRTEVRTLAVDDDDASTDVEGGALSGPVTTLRWSAHEVLRDKDFARCTPDERAEVHRLIADLRIAGASRRSRRLRPARRGRGALDLRATTRRALRTGGEPLRTERRAPSERPRRLVLLCDVSGSMDAYARALVRFAHAAALGRAPVEVFTLGTRCTRITRALQTHDPDAALDAAAAAVDDWSGGTRLGDGLRTFNDEWGQRGTARGAVVVILSDGWDRGDPDVLAEQVARLSRVAHRLVWVNPLKASPGFAPVAQGMAAALPHVDDLVEGHSLRSLEALAARLGQTSVTGSGVPR
jgi:uncharacterized protein with von Willebrand factor type A (vWA) domain